MNELLGWYGYDKLDTRGLNLKHLNQHFPTSSSSSSPMRHDEDFSEDDMGLSRSPQPDSASCNSSSDDEADTSAGIFLSNLPHYTSMSTSDLTYSRPTYDGSSVESCLEPATLQSRCAEILPLGYRGLEGSYELEESQT
ncbi:hypothetical protein AVEN_225521-1 [Araneus ventricosus]|uniref:Uncharacterized protein n=1 Tax=Araneus ventricosus TaxID=182803 RepID=A0A4Y2D181_ARAVE|nr:hypothetical protein AVEN_225521-1 [Araneus ventricosus]